MITSHRSISRAAQRVFQLIVIAAAVFWTFAVSGQGFPAFDPQDESVVIGPQVTEVPAAVELGQWNAAPNRLTLAASHEDGVNFWFPEDPRAVIGDGFVRMRIERHGSLDATLMLRAQVNPTDVDDVSGFAVVLDGRTAQINRFDHGVAQTTMVSAKSRVLKRASSVEVVAWMIGPHLSVHIFDGDKLERLVTLTHTDPSYLKGRVGVRFHRDQGKKTALTLLTVRPAGQKGTQRWTPTGKWRNVVLSTDQYRALSASLRDTLTVVAQEKRAEPPQVRLWTSPLKLERIRREGVVPISVSDQIPYWFRDSGFRAQMNKPITRTKSGFQVDGPFKDAPTVEALIRGYHQRYPKLTKLVELGRSHEGRPILALKISDHPDDDEDEPAIFFNGGHHGSELLSVEFALDGVQYLLENYASDRRVRRWVHRFELWWVPMVNPDGNMAYTQRSVGMGRKNGRDTDDDQTSNDGDGVDLNRNYPFRWGALSGHGSSGNHRSNYYRGSTPGSEPETQAIMRLADSEHFIASISYHTAATKILAPYTIDGVTNPTPSVAWSIAEELAAAAPIQPNGRRFVVERNLYPVDGVDQDWLFAAHGTVALLVEGAYHNPRDPERRRETIAATRPTWMTLLERVERGPRVFGHVVDETGAPLVAEITVKEVTLNAGERWTSRCRDGRFDRLLDSPGRYTIRANLPGLPPLEKRVRVTEGRAARVEFVFDTAGQPIPSLVTRGCLASGLCAVDTLCEQHLGRCNAPGPARWCQIDGVCVSDQTAQRAACLRCDAATHPTEWAKAPEGERCAEASCEDGRALPEARCDAAGVCEGGAATQCAPYGCDANGIVCRDRCEGDEHCPGGDLECIEGVCEQRPLIVEPTDDPAIIAATTAPLSDGPDADADPDPATCSAQISRRQPSPPRVIAALMLFVVGCGCVRAWRQRGRLAITRR